MDNNLKNQMDKLKIQAEIDKLKWKLTIDKLKTEMAIHKLESQISDKVDQFKANVSDLKENAEAYVRNTINDNQTATEESWLETLKADFKDGWSEIEDTAKDAWNQINGKN